LPVSAPMETVSHSLCWFTQNSPQTGFMWIILTMFDSDYKLWSSTLCRFLQPTVTSSLLGPNILHSTLFSNILRLCSFLNVRDRMLHPHKTRGRTVAF
jgi:hypothetical protein